jgi:tetratricopeptide (TPR) repeat protein
MNRKSWVLVAALLFAAVRQSPGQEKQPAAADARLSNTANALYDQARAALDRGESLEAAVKVDGALATQADCARAIGLRGLLETWHGSSERAKSDAEAALKLVPRDATVQMLAGEVWSALGETDRATAAFEEAIELDGKLLDARPAMARHFMDSNDYDRALALCDEVLKQDASYVPAIVLRARALTAQDKHAEALKEYDRAVTLAPRNVMALQWRADYFQQFGELGKAFADLDAAIEAVPRCLPALHIRARLNFAQRDFAAALADQDRVVLLAPQDSEMRFARGYMLHCRGEYREALADYDEAIRLDAKNGVAHLYRARIWRDRGHLDRAIADCKKAVETNPTDAEALNYLPQLYLENNQPEETVRVYTRGIEANVERPYCLQERGMQYVRMGNVEAALADADALAGFEPKDARSFLARALILEDLGKLEEALAACNVALPIAPSPQDVLTMRANIYARLGKKLEALADNDAAIRHDPTSADLFARRGTTHAVLKHYDLAAADLHRARELAGRPTVSQRSPRELSPEALKHGETQLRRMLADRPAMATYIKEGDGLWTWAVRKFAGEDTGFLIDWSPAPVKAFGAHCHVPESPDEHGAIGLNDDPTISDPGARFEKLWSGAVFELHNLIGTPEFVAIAAGATNGTIAKSDFVYRFEGQECSAGERTRDFYASIYLPWAATSKLPATTPGQWYAYDLNDPLEDRTPMSRWSRHRCQIGAGYDSNWAQRLIAKGRFSEAISMLQSVVACEPILDNSEVATAYDSLGICHRNLGDMEKAIEAFSHAIRLDAEDYHSRWHRGWIHHGLGKSVEALTDLREAQRLLRSYIAKQPNDTAFVQFLAWTLATAPYGELRNGNEAVKLATDACQRTEWNNREALEVLAAAHAEAGDFVQAIAVQRKAIEIAAPSDREGAQVSLELFQSKKPYRAEEP